MRSPRAAVLPSSRQEEIEADAIAIRLLARTGLYEPQHMVKLFSR
jgi:predicted Zn-dependent protease